MRRLACIVLLLAMATAAGCSVTPTQAGAPTATLSQRLVPVDKNGLGQLHGVSVVPTGPYYIAPGTPDDRAHSRLIARVDVGVPDSVHGVAARLVVPMWYGRKTTLMIMGTPPETSLAQAVANKAVIWAGTAVADVKYHLEDGVFVLDSLQVPPSH